MVAGGGAIALQSFSEAEEEEGLLPQPTTASSAIRVRPITAGPLVFLLPLLGFGVVVLALSGLFVSPTTLFSAAEGKKAVVAQEREPGVQQRVVEWSPEDQALRSYRWEAPAVHESLQRHLDQLTAAENRTRSWLLETRTTSTSGVGIGLGSTDPPEAIRPGAAMAVSGAFPEKGEGPGEFEGGARSKYYELVQEWQTGRPVDSCEKGSWESEYTTLHAEMMNGTLPPSLIEYTCAKEKCGGLADRLLGTASTFLYAILTRRAFSISWTQPVPFDLIFDSPHIDWSQAYPNTTTPPNPIYSDTQTLGDRLDVDAMNWSSKKVDDFFEKGVSAFKQAWVRLSLNRGTVLRSFSYPSIRPQLDQLGLTATTAYSCLLPYLIRPKKSALEFINQYTSFFALPSVFVVGVQIRTGDFSLRLDTFDSNQTVSRYSSFFTCAEAVSRTYAHPSQKIIYYLLSDSHALKEEALRMFPERVVVSGLSQSHPEIEKAESGWGWEGVKGAADGMMGSVVEMWTFAATDFQILTARSGFGKIPTWIRGRPGTTIQIFNPYLEVAYTKSLKTLPPEVDCTSDETLKSFTEMAQGWSLG
ncbi:hypothetical protein BCR35DRAFT_275012 [Leucosporidium creatinivorum]|uniref:Proteophosphoglycan ppg4 n=1 Tax=Leucosporidium creatinivorum TaxID=106004 RepID=A0A1Y2G216_9BASI|nr:hypothetical protein BCR35DRAFT_275012 [Leucosporidium creatinivorum]